MIFLFFFQLHMKHITSLPSREPTDNSIINSLEGDQRRITGTSEKLAKSLPDPWSKCPINFRETTKDQTPSRRQFKDTLSNTQGTPSAVATKHSAGASEDIGLASIFSLNGTKLLCKLGAMQSFERRPTLSTLLEPGPPTTARLGSLLGILLACSSAHGT